MSVINLTTENFEEEVLNSKRTSTGRFLGNMVWTMPDNGTGC